MNNWNNTFDSLTDRWQSIDKLRQEAESYATSDPSVALFKLRLFAEKMTDEIFRLEGFNSQEIDNQVDKLNKLEEEQILSEEILNMFHNIRKAGNKAAHSGEGTIHEVNISLKYASQLGSWFVERYIEINPVFDKFKRDAEQYVTSDPSVALFKLRIFAEKMINEVIHLEGIIVLETDQQVDKLNKLEEEQRLPEEILKIFHNIRKAGNRAAHSGEGTTEEASILLMHVSHQLNPWFTEHYVKNKGSKEQKLHGNNTQPATPVRVYKPSFSTLMLTVMAFIPFVVFIGEYIGIGAISAVIILIIYIRSFTKWDRKKYRLIVGCIFWLVCLIGVFGLLLPAGILKTTSSDSIYFSLYPPSADKEENTNTASSDKWDYSSNYDAAVYNNDKLILDSIHNLDSTDIKVGSKVYVEWTFPWGKMKSAPQQVKLAKEESESMYFEPEINPQLQKQLNLFIHEFAKQCVGAGQENNFSDICDDLSLDSNTKLVETKIDFEFSEPVMYETIFADPVLVFKLDASFSCEKNEEVYLSTGDFLLTYDKTKKSWLIHKVDDIRVYD